MVKLSLADAAALLGKSRRQVRYMIQQGRLPARKVAGRWVIEREELPLSRGQERAVARKAAALAQAVDAALAPAMRGAR